MSPIRFVKGEGVIPRLFFFMRSCEIWNARHD